MEKEDNYTAPFAMASGLVDMYNYSSAGNNPPLILGPQHDHFASGSMDRAFAGFGDVMQFADFGPRLALEHHSHGHESEDGDHNKEITFSESSQGMKDGHGFYPDQSHEENDGNEAVVQLEFLGASGGSSLNQMMMLNTTSTTATSLDQMQIKPNNNGKSNNNNSKRKRARAAKTTAEVESQRMTHIAVERNRRKQMNEHLRVLRTLMPTSYVQRGDQASIIGGAIEFARELEQLLQCLESQKRRKLYGEGGGVVPLPSNQPFDPINDPSNGNDEHQQANKLIDLDNTMMMGPLGGLQEETAENKSSIADVEVKLLGFDAFIKILSRRRPGQLIKAISALQDLQFNILHTNITTIEQTVLYSFNVQISSDTRFSAEDIASSVQQTFTFIHASTAM